MPSQPMIKGESAIMRRNRPSTPAHGAVSRSVSGARLPLSLCRAASPHTRVQAVIRGRSLGLDQDFALALRRRVSRQWLSPLLEDHRRVL